MRYHNYPLKYYTIYQWGDCFAQVLSLLQWNLPTPPQPLGDYCFPVKKNIRKYKDFLDLDVATIIIIVAFTRTANGKYRIASSQTA